MERFGYETAKLIQKEYGWYKPSPSIHSLCLHARQALADKPLPPGYYTEGSQESYNKKDRHTRHHHARRCSRKANIEDVFNSHMAYGDPLVSSCMRSQSEPKYLHSPELLDLLDSAITHDAFSSDSEDEEYDSECDSDSEFDSDSEPNFEEFESEDEETSAAEDSDDEFEF